MKNLIRVFTILSVFISSCNRGEISPGVELVKKDTITKTISDLKFKLYPTATDQFTFSIPHPQQDAKVYKLYLIKDSKELANYSLIVDQYIIGISNATVKYNFLANESYDILIRATEENKDTVFQEEFTIKNYIHKYSNKFNYEKLATINQKLDFDLSPSRNIVFYIDYINNKCVLKRLSIADKNLEVLDEDFFSLIIRSKNDNELIVSSRKLNDRFLGGDSCAFLSYDVYTKKSSLIDWGSASYGGFTRVVNNFIVLINPVNKNHYALINLSDNSKPRYYSENRYLRQHSFEEIYLDNAILDFTTFDFVNTLTLNNNSYLSYYDENSQYYIVDESYEESNTSSYFSRMIIYKNNQIVFQQPFEKGRFYNFPSLINLKDNKLIFAQCYDYDSNVRLDGYYLLDINTKEITLLQNDNDYYVKYDFFIYSDNNSFISVRPYEIYKITMY